ncbi:Methyltransferase type 12 [Kribbella flavida DSM 17836]|uniref:Methyltransferase type 12 n=1 Tax=Kribbella flavida (strain DSM 17836 / JCM 10339 / NBRC 14399) TaxID=479435 RepID=D2PM10_KRIFD|nr:class I SAM-dependent methyltransferase [Kribbella flavida]ADB32590.1 Methyltransferase type 12 [Kribbella flavida DSM 17836]
MDAIRRHTATNRTSWNQIAPSRPTPPPRFYLDGGSTLDDFEPGLLPDLAGRRMLHLACANGADSISWAFRGASVTGVDISDVAVAAANTLAQATGADARFLAADIYDLPAHLTDFDVVYSSWGVVCWLPDLDRWAEIVAARLRPGGTFLLCEHHPIWEVLAVRSDTLEVTVDYFGRNLPTTQTYDQSKRPTGSTATTEFDAFLWPVSDVVMSLVNAGLQLTHFTEAAQPDMYPGLTRSTFVPATYTIRTTKPV